MNKKSRNNIEQYWREKELEIDEKIIGKDMVEYISGSQLIRERCWGLLYYTENFLNFQLFPKKNFLASLLRGGKDDCLREEKTIKISWKDVQKICFPPERNKILAFFTITDRRIFIDYFADNKARRFTLILLMHSHEKREKILEFYKPVTKNNKLG